MSKILVKKRINSQINCVKLEAPSIADNAKPGQFVVIKIDEKGERMPLTIVSGDRKKGTITLVFQEIGKTTKKLSSLNAGDSVMDVIGPLGKPTRIEKIGRVVCIGGGVGTAEIYPVARAFHDAGNDVVSIIGARSKELLFFVEEIKAVSSRVYVTTDDGSAGRKGLVTDVLRELLGKEKFGLVHAVGPLLMMRAAAEETKRHHVKTIVSLNANMVDATGMCGTCRVTVGGQTRFSCVEGPDFDAHKLDFHELLNRERRFKDEEEESLRLYEETESRRKG